MKFNAIIYDKDNGIGTITLNRPESMNAINRELIRELDGCFDEIAKDSEVTRCSLPDDFDDRI